MARVAEACALLGRTDLALAYTGKSCVGRMLPPAHRPPQSLGGLYIHAEPPLDLNSWQWGLAVRLAVWQYNSMGGLPDAVGGFGLLPVAADHDLRRGRDEY